MIRNRKTSKKPSKAFIGHFQQAFADLIPQPDNSEGHSSLLEQKSDEQPGIENDILGDDHQGVANPLTHDAQGVDFSSWVDCDPANLMEPISQFPVSQGFNTGGKDPLFSNLAGVSHTPKFGLITSTVPYSYNAFHETQPSFDQFGSQSITGQVPRMSFSAKNFSYAPSLSTRESTAMNEIGSRSLPKGPIHDSAPDESAAKHAISSEVPMNNRSGGRGDKFRFNIALDAPTAMVEYPETCESYLNKGQTYNVRVIDTSPSTSSSRPLQYRTFVRVSFENEEQRSNPASSWQLWADSRGSDEANLTSGVLSAVEYIHPESVEAKMDYDIQLEQTSVDGFCVIWSARRTASLVHCLIFMRFNFTSTDFSHSKGVKGIPLRLCAKTEVLSSEDPGIRRETELCYCKVKVFRDHGAERKSTNDKTRVKKAITKLKGELALAQATPEIGLEKRKRRRMSLDGAAESLPHKDDVQRELTGKQNMLQSTLTISSLNSRGDREDDPDLFPVQLPTRNTLTQTHNNASEAAAASFRTPVSANTSSRDSKSQERKEDEIKTLDNPTRDPIDQSLPKQDLTACFLIRFADDTSDYYRAIYLTEHTSLDLTRKICDKRHIDPSHVVRILRINADGLQIVVDNDVVRELPEGQSIIVEIDNDPSLFGNIVTVDPAVEIRLKY